MLKKLKFIVLIEVGGCPDCPWLLRYESKETIQTVTNF